MSKLRILGLGALAFMMLAPDVMAQRRGGGGGAVRGGMRGAMVGGMVGGSSGAQTGAEVGAVAGATRGVAQRAEQRNAINSETQARTQYQATAEYQNAQHSNFNEAPPEVLVTGPSTESAAPEGEAIIRKNGKPIVGITYPADWKQKAGERYASATSADGQAWSVIALIEGATDQQAAIAKVKQGLEKHLQNISYDEPTKTERGALLVTGTGKGKKAGVDVVFATGVFNTGSGQLAGVAFIVDKDLEEHYKETVRSICQTIRGEKDFTEQEHEVAKPVTSNR